MLIDWSEEYAIGIEKIDEQHKGFFTAVDRLHEECMASEDEKIVPETLDFLKQYAVAHFEAEEKLMREIGFPGLDDHLKLHEEFLEQYAELVEEFNELGTSQDLAEKTGEMVQSWLVNHIAEADTQYARYAQQQS